MEVFIMKIYIVPMEIENSKRIQYNIAVRIRQGENPALFMENVTIAHDENNKTKDNYYTSNDLSNFTTSISVIGDIVQGMTLQDGDALLVQTKSNPLKVSIEVNVENQNGTYVSEGVLFDSINMAARMEDGLCVCIADTAHANVISTASQISDRVKDLYSEFPAFKNIMIKNEEGETEELTLLSLIASQDKDFIKWAETMLLSMSSKYKTLFPVAKQILEQSTADKGFSLLSKEEQVAAFLEFSKKHAEKAVEAVPDRLIEYLKKSPEYKHVMMKLEQAGLGKSRTQQFNVLQQVGYFGGTIPFVKKDNVIYNLSDMGAGKTLMTVEAIFMLDCINIGIWNRKKKKLFVDIQSVYLPDKYIIAPALSVKASWVDTFKLFYNVEKIDDCHYVLTAEYAGTKAFSDLYIAPFTVRGGKVFVHETLPAPTSTDAYLIVDEIHQLVRRRISRTKFFVPKITPVNTYRIFALSGTMSNLKSGEWLSLIRFLGDTSILKNATDAKNSCTKLEDAYYNSIGEVAKDIESLQHKKFNIDDYTIDNGYNPTIKKKSVVEENYFMQYGSKLLTPRHEADGMSIQDILSGKKYIVNVEPEESDNVSFELFYRIAATSAITAQSLQVAEELFGKQKTQHKSSIIRTMSPFTDEEIFLLDTLHKIASDANKYRSQNIGRDINNAILNLNDGLQQKDLYTLVSEHAEKNNRFLEYLSGLSVDVLERLPKTSLIKSPKLTETHKFHVLKELLEKDKDETFLIVVNDFYAMKSLAEALGVSYLSKQELKDEMAYQELLDDLFKKQSVVIVTQDMIKSSLDLVQANRLVQYQLNTEVSDIIQTQNRINRIGQKRETKCFYIAADRLQNTLIELFLDSYRNIRVAHKGIVELFADLSSQIDVINDYLNVAFKKLNENKDEVPEEGYVKDSTEESENLTDIMEAGAHAPKNVQAENGICNAILLPEKNGTGVIIPLKNGRPFRLGTLKSGIVGPVVSPVRAVWNLREMKLVQ